MRFSTRIGCAASLILCVSQSISFAAECSAKSGMKTVPLLELYTSEGCSSCPPADKWLSGLSRSGQFVPLAFHVDYWDYIGWKDRFSKAEYSDRQRKAAALSGLGFVYTPQFVLNGRDFKGWDESRLQSVIEKSQRQPARANLQLQTQMQENGEIILKTSAQVVDSEDLKHADIFIALYENKLSSKVKAGENNGRELKHDYVVRDFFGAYQFGANNAFSKNFILKSEWKGRDAGAVIFVQDDRNGEIMQSLQLPFCS